MILYMCSKVSYQDRFGKVFLPSLLLHSCLFPVSVMFSCSTHQSSFRKKVNYTSVDPKQFVRL